MLRSRLRRFLIHKVAAIEREAGREDQAGVLEMVIDAENCFEANALTSWISVVNLWGTRWQCDEPVRWLRACVRQALAAAVDEPLCVSLRKADYPIEQVDAWVREFVAGIEPDELICSSGPAFSFDLRATRPYAGHEPEH